MGHTSGSTLVVFWQPEADGGKWIRYPKTTHFTAGGLERGIEHWKKEMASAKEQIRSGRYPMYDANCRKYMAECRVYINMLVAQRGKHP